MQLTRRTRCTSLLVPTFFTCFILTDFTYWQLYRSVVGLQTTAQVKTTTEQTTKTTLETEKLPKNSSLPPVKEHLNRPKPTIIILTMRRSGSSIFGSMFNQKNSQVFYLYEPLFPFNETCKKLERVKVIKHLSKCHFEKIQPLYEKAYIRFNRTDTFSGCRANNVCFGGHSKKISAFLPRKICKNGNTSKFCKKSNMMYIKAISENCSQNLMVVMKLVHLCKLEWLLPLLQDPGYNIKIIHLVRDPRATVKSRTRRKLYKTATVRKYAKKICGQLLSNLDFADNALRYHGLRGKYLRIRYEDFARDPVGTARKVFHFIGLKITYDIEDWLWQATAPINHKDLSRITDYGLLRNAKHVMSAWRTELSLYKVTEIQKLCYEPLKRLGYAMYETEDVLRNLLRLHFVPANHT